MKTNDLKNKVRNLLFYREYSFKELKEALNISSEELYALINIMQEEKLISFNTATQKYWDSFDFF